jgi:hypothetical protein
VTTPVRGTTLLVAANPEDPEAFVPASALAAAVTAIGALTPADVYRPVRVQALERRGLPPDRLRAGTEITLAVDMAGTAWPGSAAETVIVVTRAGATIAQLACAARSGPRIVSGPWPVPAGAGPYDVSVRLGAHLLGPVPLTLEATP